MEPFSAYRLWSMCTLVWHTLLTREKTDELPLRKIWQIKYNETVAGATFVEIFGRENAGKSPKFINRFHQNFPTLNMCHLLNV